MDIKSKLIIAGASVAVILVLLLLSYFALKNYNGHNRLLLFLRFKIFRIKSNRPKYATYYSVKPRYLSPYELQYYNILQNILSNNYYIFPQVPLSQIIEKHSASNYRTELYRVVDFCIFDKEYYPLLCIEINDSTHLKKDRTKRDSKVAEILKSARLPLITFWTYEEINVQVIRKKLRQFNIV